MNWKPKLLGVAAGLAVALAATSAAAWYFVFNTDAPDPVSLESAVESAGQEPATGQPSDADLIGEWLVSPGGESFAGYRINQELAGGLGTETVVGRTAEVEGSLTFDGSAITAADVTVDMTTLRSDESLRDNVLGGEGLETDAFPEASFTLTSPVPVDAIPADGQTVTRSVEGELTLHGVTQPVLLDMQAVLEDGRLFVVGSKEIALADYGMTPPSGPASVLSVADRGTLEMQLVFEQAA